MNDKKISEESSTPQWLQTIQLNSWEAELLISALVLYALFQIPDYIEEFALVNFDRSSLFHNFFNILIRAVELLSMGYITHILVRGVWVANVGLSYVFPNGIVKERLKFKGKFARELEKQSSIVKGVLKLEELSSLIYGISFLLFGCLLGFGTLFLPFIILGEWLTDLVIAKSDWIVVAALAIFFYFVFLTLLFIDFVTNGLFRRVDWMARIYYPLSVLFRFLTLSFLYRRALLVLISNVKGWKSYLIPVVLVLSTAGFILLRKQLSITEKNKYLLSNQVANMVPANYEDKRAKGDFFFASIQSDVISEGVIRVFLNDVRLFDELHSLGFTVGEQWDQLNSAQSSILLNQWMRFTIDSSRVYEPDWFLSQHPKNMSFGFTTFLDIQDLNRGFHTFTISFDTANMSRLMKDELMDSEYAKLTAANIQFFYNPN